MAPGELGIEEGCPLVRRRWGLPLVRRGREAAEAEEARCRSRCRLSCCQDQPPAGTCMRPSLPSKGEAGLLAPLAPGSSSARAEETRRMSISSAPCSRSRLRAGGWRDTLTSACVHASPGIRWMWGGGEAEIGMPSRNNTCRVGHHCSCTYIFALIYYIYAHHIYLHYIFALLYLKYYLHVLWQKP